MASHSCHFYNNVEGETGSWELFLPPVNAQQGGGETGLSLVAPRPAGSRPLDFVWPRWAQLGRRVPACPLTGDRCVMACDELTVGLRLPPQQAHWRGCLAYLVTWIWGVPTDSLGRGVSWAQTACEQHGLC